MGDTKPAGGPTQDEIMAISLFKLGITKDDTVLDLGCGTGKVSIAAARLAKKVCAVDRREEAIRYARREAERGGTGNIEFFCGEALDFLKTGLTFDCAFVGGSRQVTEVLPVLAEKVKRSIVVNAVLVHTVSTVVETMGRLGIFEEALTVQVSRSHRIGGSIMWKPIDPVYVIVGRGNAC